MKTVTGIAKFTLGGMWKFEIAYSATVEGDKVLDVAEESVYRFDYPIHASANAEGEYWDALYDAACADINARASV